MGEAAAKHSKYILLTDICDSTRLAEAYPDAYLELLDAHNSAINKTCNSREGSILNFTGDGFLVAFSSISQLLHAAASIRSEMSQLDSFPDGTTLTIKLAGDFGEVTQTPTGWIGLALHRLSRIEKLCHPEQTVVTGRLRALFRVNPEDDFRLTYIGTVQIKGFKELEELYQVNLSRDQVTAFPPLVKDNSTRVSFIVSIVIVVLLIMIGVFQKQSIMSKQMNALRLENQKLRTEMTVITRQQEPIPSLRVDLE